MSNPSAVLYAPGDLRIEDRPMPSPAPGEVLVRVQAVGICGSDVHYYEHGRIGPYIVEDPMVVGHESAGSIVAVGETVDPARIGELVAIEPGVPCRQCEQCRIGQYNLCPNVRFFATPPVDGSICHFVTIDADFAHTAPAGVTAEEAAMAEPISVGVWAATRAEIHPTDRVLVTGAGPIGIYAAQVARAFGATSVTVTDVNDVRLEKVRQLGLDARRADVVDNSQFTVLLECSGAPAALSGGMKCLLPRGRVVLVGMGVDEVPIEVPLVQGRELSIMGIFRYSHTYPLALSLIATGAVDAKAVITHRFDLGHTEDALTLVRRDPGSLKAVVVPAL
jgi:L-iditol 2-dehydrogenase